MEDRDPVIALQACITAIRRSGWVGEEGSSSTELVQCLRRVGESLSEKDREIEWLREALEQSRETYNEHMSCLTTQQAYLQPLSGNDMEGGDSSQLMGSVRDEGGVVNSLESEPDPTTVAQDLVPVLEQWSGNEEKRPHPTAEGSGETGQEGEGKMEVIETDTANIKLGSELTTINIDGAHSITATTSSVSESLPVYDNREGDHGGQHTDDASITTTTTEVTYKPSDKVETTSQDEAMSGGSGMEGGTDGVVVSGVDGTSSGNGGWLEESEGYQKVPFAALYYHAATGYYYDATTQQFYAPATTSGYQETGQSHQETGQPNTSTDQSTYESGPTGPSVPRITSVADMLAAVSEHASQKCGLSYDEASGLYYDHGYAMYYDHDTQLYYDPESGTYYEYDAETRQYQVHSHAKLPKKKPNPEEGVEKVTKLYSSSDSENEGSLEEGELNFPRYPEGSPPPEEEWAPCLRLVVSSSECVPRGSVYVITQEGAQIGREPGGPNPVELREVQVSKSHVDIKYSRTNGCFTLCDLASQNGTILNNERISEPKVQSKPHPLNHNDIFTIGTTSFTLHIHAGWDTCEWCRWEERGGGEGEGEKGQEGKVPWKKELNRIKKRYGLRLKDTYGEKVVRVEGYKDRAEGRRKKIGSDIPDLAYPDAAPASVHRAVSEDSVGHKMLKKLGWKKGEGLGKGNKGRIEPVKADIHERRSGLGSTVGGGTHSLDTAGNESTAKHRRLMKHYSQVVARETTGQSKQQ